MSEEVKEEIEALMSIYEEDMQGEKICNLQQAERKNAGCKT